MALSFTCAAADLPVPPLTQMPHGRARPADSTSKRQRLREFVDLSRPLDKEEHLGQVECGVRQPASPLRAPRDYVPRHAGRVPDQRFPLPRPGGGAAVSSAIAGPAGYLTFVRTAFAEPVHPGRP